MISGVYFSINASHCVCVCVCVCTYNHTCVCMYGETESFEDRSIKQVRIGLTSALNSEGATSHTFARASAISACIQGE